MVTSAGAQDEMSMSMIINYDDICIQDTRKVTHNDPKKGPLTYVNLAIYQTGFL